MVERITRGLTEPERRALVRQLTQLRREGSALLRRLVIVTLATSVVFAVLTVLASDASTPVILAVWAAIAVGLGGWIWLQEGARLRMNAGAIDSALQTGTVEELRISSEAFVSLDEVADEGACFALDAGDGGIIFVTGQEFYPTRAFPSADFSLVHVYDARKRLVDFRIDNRGRPLVPVRTIPAAVKRRLRWPAHLERIEGRLEDLERLLAEGRPHYS